MARKIAENAPAGRDAGAALTGDRTLPFSAAGEVINAEAINSGGRASMKPTVFIHTNEKQIVGAIVSAYSLKRNSANADKFDVRILEVKDFPFLRARHGQKFLRGGVQRVWDMDDLQSFTPLRYAPPALMGYEGQAAIIDPDIFAAGDVWELLSRDMRGKALMCRAR